MVILMWRVGQEMGTDDATHLAAGVAYYAIFSLFPLLLGLLFILGLVVTSEGVQQDFVGFVTDNLPGSEQFVKDTLDGVIRFRGVLGVGAVVGLLWSASAVFGAISRAVNRAWDVHQDRPFYIAKPRQIGMALVVGVLFLTSTSATYAIELLTNPDSGIPGQQVFLELTFRAVSWLMVLSIFLLMYRFIPNCKTYWRYIWPGAVVAAVLLEIGRSLFLWYLNNLASYSQFGALASVLILLFWIYLSSLIVILGAEISSEYGRMQRGVERGVLLHPRRRSEDEKPSALQMSNLIQGERVGLQARLRPGASAIIFDRARRRVLLTRRSDNGRWCLPDGGMEPGESVEETCIRVVREETGLEVQVTRLVGVYTSPDIMVEYADGNRIQPVAFSFVAEVAGGDLRLSEETIEHEYFAVDELDTIDLMEHHRQRVEDAIQNLAAAFFK